MLETKWLFLAGVVLAGPVAAAPPDAGVPAQPKPKPEVPVGPMKTAEDKAIYVLGFSMGRNVEPLNLSKSEQQIFMLGVSDVLAGKKPEVPPPDYGPRIRPLFEARQPLAVAARAKRDQPVLDHAAKEKGAQVTPSGIVYVPITEGTGAQPKPTDVVKVQYKGMLTDTTEFDSSYRRGQPAEFPLGGGAVIGCWSEGVPKMKVGGKAKLYCPASTAYKERGNPQGGIPGGAVLVFEIELLETKPAPPPAPAPTPTPVPGK